ncbi:MAG: hypothetical protein HQL50_09145 [Magnetococcales bacterium]|nr:hypothetical protein [Magnetococcales bacterium]
MTRSPRNVSASAVGGAVLLAVPLLFLPTLAHAGPLGDALQGLLGGLSSMVAQAGGLVLAAYATILGIRLLYDYLKQPAWVDGYDLLGGAKSITKGDYDLFQKQKKKEEKKVAKQDSSRKQAVENHYYFVNVQVDASMSGGSDDGWNGYYEQDPDQPSEIDEEEAYWRSLESSAEAEEREYYD